MELANLINKKIEEKKGESKNEESKSDLNRLIQITKQTEVKKINDRNDSYIKIIEKYNKKTRQINMAFEFLRFCKKTLNPYVHASGKTIEYYLLPKICLDDNYNSSKYMITLDDILLKKVEPNDNKNETISKINVPEADIYKNKKILTINESLKILLSEKIVLSDLNKEFSDEIKKKRNI
jgi:RNase P subunit RPR2